MTTIAMIRTLSGLSPADDHARQALLALCKEIAP
jgi:hypothetical protein